VAKSLAEKWVKLLAKAEEATTRKKANKCLKKAEKLGQQLSTEPTNET